MPSCHPLGASVIVVAAVDVDVVVFVVVVIVVVIIVDVIVKSRKTCKVLTILFLRFDLSRRPSERNVNKHTKFTN